MVSGEPNGEPTAFGLDRLTAVKGSEINCLCLRYDQLEHAQVERVVTTDTLT
jgi:hypothetical protein